MNHQPFRGWLLADDELSVEQSRLLQEHLRDCQACRQINSAWQELEAVIERSSQLEPLPGFVDRWQIRLVEHRDHQQRLRGWYTIGATSLVVISLLVVMMIQVWSLIQNPDAFLAAWLDQLAGLASLYFTARNLALSINLLGPVYTLAAMVLVSGLISFTSVLWLATYRKISMVRREA